MKIETNRILKNRINFFEILLFYSMVIVGLIPLLTRKYFVTSDGPAHLYNGVLIKALISGNYPEINHIFQFFSGAELEGAFFNGSIQFIPAFELRRKLASCPYI